MMLFTFCDYNLRANIEIVDSFLLVIGMKICCCSYTHAVQYIIKKTYFFQAMCREFFDVF